MAKTGPSPLLTLASLLLFLAGEVGGWLHRVMFRPTPHRCIDLAGTTPPMCVHSLRPITTCDGTKRR